MYYVELIDRFWVFSERVKPGTTAISLYLYLLNIAKENDSYQFRMSDVELGKRLGISRATIKTAREKLRDLGVVEYEAVNGAPISYRLIINYPFDDVNFEQTKIDLSDAVICCDNGHLQIESWKAPRNSVAGDSADEAFRFAELSEEKGTRPDLREFLEYAGTLDAYSPELEVLIRAKYSSWLDNDWKNVSGRYITNWRSSLKSVLPFLVSETKHSQLSIDKIPDIRHPRTES
ncbi:MAG: hypothetical protein E2600_10485 [Chryseobacterium sp.]|nr:hypothetical protein [Chryseobacterium sp.]